MCSVTLFSRTMFSLNNNWAFPRWLLPVYYVVLCVLPTFPPPFSAVKIPEYVVRENLLHFFMANKARESLQESSLCKVHLHNS